MVIVPDFSFVVDESTSGTRIGIPKGETALLNRINEIIDESQPQAYMTNGMRNTQNMQKLWDYDILLPAGIHIIKKMKER